MCSNSNVRVRTHGILLYFNFARISSALTPLASSFLTTLSASAFLAASAAFASAAAFLASSFAISFSVCLISAFFGFGALLLDFYFTENTNNHLCLNAEVIIMKTLLKKSAILKTISLKIGAYLHKIDSVPQEDDSDFEDEEWMDYPTKPTLSHVILDLLLSPTYRLPKTVTAVRIYRDENIFSVCPRCDVCIEREYQRYCHRCGQYLDWSRLEDAEEIFMGWGGVEDDD